MKNGGSEGSLKSQNFKWHLALATADAIILILFVAPELVTKATTTQLGVYRAIGAAVLPIVVLFLLNLMSSKDKAMLAYWKPYGWLPGSEAFTKYGPADPRVDMVQLKKNVGVLPVNPREQNAKWYRLYKMVENQPEVAYAQNEFLIYRDMGAMSLPLVIIAPIGLYFSDVTTKSIWGAAALFLLQYVITAISARNAGERFVCNVLALHAARKFPLN